MREVYRIHQDFVQDLFSCRVFGFHGVFLAMKSGLTYGEVRDDMLPMLEKVRDRLELFKERNSKDQNSGTYTNSEIKQI